MTRRIAEIDEVIGLSEEYDVISFDLFDTIIHRPHISYSDILALSARFLTTQVAMHAKRETTIKEVLFLRSHVTNLLKSSIMEDTEEPKLRDIFQRILYCYGVSGKNLANSVAKSVRFELSLDLSGLEVLGNAERVLVQLRDSNKRILAISDMYYEDTEIKQILRKLRLLKYFDDIYISASIGYTKQTSNLFAKVVEVERICVRQILHIGDNYMSDVRMAEAQGVSSLHFKRAPLKRTINPEHFNIVSLVTELAASFVYDLALEAHSRQLEKLFFLSRDATILEHFMKQVAEESDYVANLLHGIEIRSLDINRKVGMFMELTDKCGICEVMMLYLWQRPKGFPLTDLCEMLNVVVPEKSKDLFFRDKHQVKEFSLKISETSIGFESLVVGAAREHAKSTIHYLVQEGVLGAGHIGFVDIGYTGTVVRNIAYYVNKELDLSEISSTRISLFLMAVGNGIERNLSFSYPLLQSRTVAENFYSLFSLNEIPWLLKGNFCWLECFFQDYHEGALLRYYIGADGKIKPARLNKEMPDERFCLEGSLARRSFENSSNIRFASHNYRKEIKQLFLRKMSNPDPETLITVASLVHSTGGADDREGSIVKQGLGFRDMFPKKLRKLILDDIWLAGSLKASNKELLIRVLPLILKIRFGVIKQALKGFKKIEKMIMRRGSLV